MMNNEEKMAEIAVAFAENRERLLRIAELKIPDALRKRISAEDLLQDSYIAISKRWEHFFQAEEVPIFVRIRTMMLQTLIDLERKHLVSQKRAANCEIDFDAPANLDNSSVADRWSGLANTMTSPRTMLERQDRYSLIHETLKALSENDQEIIMMRNFENLTNSESAAILNIEPKAASIRYFRAIKKFKELLIELSEFRP